MKPNDTQLILLSNASQRGNGSLMPLPDALDADRAGKAIASLIKKSLAEEGPVTDSQLSWRKDGDSFIGVRITDAGCAAIRVDGSAGQDETAPSPAPAQEPEKKPTKAALVLEMLRRDGGATLDEMVTATGWLPHTTRAALTGLRKKGHSIEKAKRGDVTCYRIVEAP